MIDFALGCPACERRAYAVFQCFRLSGITLAFGISVDYYNALLEEIVWLQAEAFETHPPREGWLN